MKDPIYFQPYNYYPEYRFDDSKPFQRKRYKGFCENLRCSTPGNAHFIKGRMWAYVTEQKGKSFCPRCNHALFWTSSYFEIPNSETQVEELKELWNRRSIIGRKSPENHTLKDREYTIMRKLKKGTPWGPCGMKKAL